MSNRHVSFTLDHSIDFGPSLERSKSLPYCNQKEMIATNEVLEQNIDVSVDVSMNKDIEGLPCEIRLPATSKNPEKEEEFIKDLVFLEHSTKDLTNKQLVTSYTNILLPSLFIGMYSMAWVISLTMALFVCNYSGNIAFQSAFGLASFVKQCTFAVFESSVSELVSLRCSQAIGQQNYYLARKYLTQGLYTLIILNLTIILPIAIFSRGFFIAIGFDVEIAGECSYILRILFGLACLAEVAYLYNSYLFCQGIESSALGLSLFKSIGIPVSTVFFGIYCGWGFDGWVFSMAIFESANLCLVMRLYFYFSRPECRGLVSLSETFVGFMVFFRDSLIFICGMLGEWTGWELLNYFTGLTRNQYEITAVTSLVNVAYFVFAIGMGLMTTARTRINTLIGANLKNAAKRFTMICFVGITFTGIALGFLVFVLAKPIAYFYTGNTYEAFIYLWGCIQLYAFVISLDLIYYLVFSLARTVGLAYWNIGLNLIFVIGVHSVIGRLLYVYGLLNCYTVIMNMYTQFFVIFAILIYKICTMDWSRVSTEEELKQSKELSLKDNLSILSGIIPVDKLPVKTFPLERIQTEKIDGWHSFKDMETKDFKIQLSPNRDEAPKRKDKTQMTGMLTELLVLPTHTTELHSEEKA